MFLVHKFVSFITNDSAEPNEVKEQLVAKSEPEPVKPQRDPLSEFQHSLTCQLRHYYREKKAWNTRLAKLITNPKDRFPLCDDVKNKAYLQQLAKRFSQYLETPETYIKEHLNHVINKYNETMARLESNPVTTTDTNALQRANCYAALTMLNELIYLANNLNAKIDTWLKDDALLENIEEEAIELSVQLLFNETVSLDLVDDLANRNELFEKIHEVTPSVERLIKMANGLLLSLQLPAQTKSSLYQPASVASLNQDRVENTSSLESMRRASRNLT